MACKRIVPLNLYEEQTTYNIAYKNPNVDRSKIKFYHAPFEHPNTEKKITPQPYTKLYLNTMQPWVKHIPFDALWQPKEILQTHPQLPFDKNMKPTKIDNTEAIKNRPRVWMLPQISMDDISDPKTREFIVENMYISDWKKISSEIPHKCTKRDIPNITYEDPRFKIDYKYDLVKHWPLVSPCNWEEKLKEWEENYPKNVVDQTFGFWEDYKNKQPTVPAGVDPYKNYVSKEEKDEIRCLIKKNELSFVYDKQIPGYTGYVPRFACGPLRKQDIVPNPYASLKKN